MKISLALITLNEIEGTRAMFDKIPWEAVDEAIVVDGNSVDGTAEYFMSRKVRVVRQPAPGLGEAMLTARASVTGDALIFFHPDGNEDPADIPKFRPLLEQGFDFVIASRMIPGGYNEEDKKWLRPRKSANLGFALIANTLWRREGPYVTDMMNGFRAVTCEAFDRMRLDARGCAIDYQMCIRALKAGMKVHEFATREGERIAGVTSFKSIPTGLKMLKLLRSELRVGRRSFQTAEVAPPVSVAIEEAPLVGKVEVAAK